MSRLFKGLAFLLILSGSTSQAGQPSTDHFTDDGFRGDRYRSPTPAKVKGAETINAERLITLAQNHPDLVIIDVINLEYRDGQFLQTEPHPGIPGAHWLPNTGKAPLKATWASYLLKHVERLTGGRNDVPIAVYCKSDCWLSWNATRRLSRAGYKSLYWLRNGIDGWLAADQSTVLLQPEKRRSGSTRS